MDTLQIPKPMGITLAVVFALTISIGLWNRFTPSTISKEFQIKDAERARREEGNPEALKDGAGPKTPEEKARVDFYSDRAYQPETGAR